MQVSKAMTPSRPGWNSDILISWLWHVIDDARRHGRPAAHLAWPTTGVAIRCGGVPPDPSSRMRCGARKDVGVTPRTSEPGALRREYGDRALCEADLAADWVEQFRRWFADAVAAGLPEPNAMIIA